MNRPSTRATEKNKTQSYLWRNSQSSKRGQPLSRRFRMILTKTLPSAAGMQTEPRPVWEVSWYLEKMNPQLSVRGATGTAEEWVGEGPRGNSQPSAGWNNTAQRVESIAREWQTMRLKCMLD